MRLIISILLLLSTSLAIAQHEAKYESNGIYYYPKAKLLKTDTLEILTVFVSEKKAIEVKPLKTIRRQYQNINTSGAWVEYCQYETIGIDPKRILWREPEGINAIGSH